MNELSLHILDLVQNSIVAGATLIVIEITIEGNMLTVTIIDNGCGMSQEMLAKVTSPFTTSRTTRRVGLGIPMFEQTAQLTGGSFSIESTAFEGTRISASFMADSIDRPPMGDLQGTMLVLIMDAPEKPDFLLKCIGNGDEFIFDTREIREELGGLPLNLPEIIEWERDFLQEGITSTLGGI